MRARASRENAAARGESSAARASWGRPLSTTDCRAWAYSCRRVPLRSTVKAEKESQSESEQEQEWVPSADPAVSCPFLHAAAGPCSEPDPGSSARSAWMDRLLVIRPGLQVWARRAPS